MVAAGHLAAFHRWARLAALLVYQPLVEPYSEPVRYFDALVSAFERQRSRPRSH